MKTTIEINGFEIVIEETDGLITVSAMQDEETIEEFEIQTGAQSDDEGEGDEVQDFGDFEDEDGEESDDMDDMESFGGEEEEEDLDDDSEEEEEEEGKLESFKSFFNKKSKLKK